MAQFHFYCIKKPLFESHLQTLVKRMKRIKGFLEMYAEKPTEGRVDCESGKRKKKTKSF